MSELKDALVIEGIIDIPAYLIKQLLWERWHRDSHQALEKRIDNLQNQLGNLALGLTADIRFEKEAHMNFKKILDGLLPSKRKGQTMELFSQRDERWAGKQLGVSRYTMGTDGCLVTSVAQVLVKYGVDTDPGRLCDGLNSIGGFTDENYPAGAGLLLWNKISELHPEFHYGEHVEGRANPTFRKGVWGKIVHWLSDDEGQQVDPWYGVDHAPEGWHEIDGSKIASIDKKPEPEPAVETPEQATPEFPRTITVTSDVGVFVRTEPNTTSSKVNYFTHQPDENYVALPKGATFEAVELVEGEEVEGNNKWYKSAYGNFTWTGACN